MTTISFFRQTCHFALSSLRSQGAPPLGTLVITLVATVLLFPTLVHAATTPAHEAAEAGDTKRLEALLDKDPDLINAKNDSGIQPLHMAAWEGHDQGFWLALFKSLMLYDLNRFDRISSHGFDGLGEVAVAGTA